MPRILSSCSCWDRLSTQDHERPNAGLLETWINNDKHGLKKQTTPTFVGVARCKVFNGTGVCAPGGILELAFGYGSELVYWPLKIPKIHIKTEAQILIWWLGASEIETWANSWAPTGLLTIAKDSQGGGPHGVSAQRGISGLAYCQWFFCWSGTPKSVWLNINNYSPKFPFQWKNAGQLLSLGGFPTSFRETQIIVKLFSRTASFHPVPEKRLGRRATWEEVFEEKIR